MKHAPRAILIASTLLADIGCRTTANHPGEVATALSPAGTGPAAGTPAEASPQSDAVKVEFYVISTDAYGAKAIDAVIPALKKMGKAADFQLGHIGDDMSFMHFTREGYPDDVDGDIAQLCAASLAPDRAVLFDFLTCQHRDLKAVASSWSDCAASAGIDALAMAGCMNGQKGKDLLAASFERSARRGGVIVTDQDGGDLAGAKLFIDGREYRGDLDGEAMLKAMCYVHQGPGVPEACEGLPPFNVTIVNDPRCGAECDRLVT